MLNRRNLRKLILQEYKRIIKEEQEDSEAHGSSDINRHAEVMAKLDEILELLQK